MRVEQETNENVRRNLQEKQLGKDFHHSALIDKLVRRIRTNLILYYIFNYYFVGTNFQKHPEGAFEQNDNSLTVPASHLKSSFAVWTAALRLASSFGLPASLPIMVIFIGTYCIFWNFLCLGRLYDGAFTKRMQYPQTASFEPSLQQGIPALPSA
jgi:hypothetical protein